MKRRTRLPSGLVKNFFVQGHWEKLPSSWREPLEALSPVALAQLLMHPTVRPSSVWPLSLLAFLGTVHALRLPGQLRSRAGVEAGDATLGNERHLDNGLYRGSDVDRSMNKIDTEQAGKRGGNSTERNGGQRVTRTADVNGRCTEECQVDTELRRAVSRNSDVGMVLSRARHGNGECPRCPLACNLPVG